jgi:hypothetical protein
MSHDTNPTAASAATTRARIDRGAPQLIGVFHLHDGPRALVRLQGGKIRTLFPGSRLGGAIVIAIGETSIVLDRDGVEIVLSLPAT